MLAFGVIMALILLVICVLIPIISPILVIYFNIVYPLIIINLLCFIIIGFVVDVIIYGQ